MILLEPDQRWRARTKICSICNKRKSWTEFSPKGYWPDGSVKYVQYACRPCRAISQRTDHVRATKRAWHAQRKARLATEVKRQKHSPRLPVLPFRKWLWVEKRKMPLSEIAMRTGVPERSLLRVLKENEAVELDLVDRVLLSSPIRLEDLYGEAELRCAA